jgi:hypothetical protein
MSWPSGLISEFVSWEYAPTLPLPIFRNKSDYRHGLSLLCPEPLRAGKDIVVRLFNKLCSIFVKETEDSLAAGRLGQDLS